jgi:hypothetical protein
MKNFILLLAFFLISYVHAGTCTSISRTNSASLSVLTSTKYNTDLNTVYSAYNAIDGGCITSGTLESDALNTSDFAPLLKGLQQGCKVIYSNASTVQIDKCIASVNGEFVATTTTTNAAFGCSGCSSEVASTTYYVYIQTGSAGSALTPLILTTAPNNDGYDNTGNKVLARFYNNGLSNIDQYSIDQWSVSRFVPTNLKFTSYTVPASQGLGTLSNSTLEFSRDGSKMLIKGRITAGTTTASTVQIGLPSGYQTAPIAIIPEVQHFGTYAANKASATSHGGFILASAGLTYFNLSERSVFGSGGATPLTPAGGTGVSDNGDDIGFNASIPIEGWEE